MKSLGRFLQTTVIPCIILLGFYCTALAQVTFDLSRDFSTNSNPNGVWSYGYKTNLPAPLVAFSFSKFSRDDGGLFIFDWAISAVEPSAVYFNPSTSQNSVGGGATIPPRGLWFYAGVEGHTDNYGAIRFTAPSNATYQVQVNVQSPYASNVAGDTDFHVVVNGVEVYGEYLPTNAPASYSNTLELAVGGTVDFLVGRGADGKVNNSGLKIQAILTATSINSNSSDGTVVPAESQNQTGDGGTGILGQVLREQDVYASSYFTNGPILITEIRFRPYRMVGAFSTVVSNLQISLSTTAARWDGLSSTYANNVGADATVVYSGAANISSASSGPTAGPKDFDISIQLQTPFVYNPAAGNLLFDIKNFSGAPALSGLNFGNVVDGSGSGSDKASRAFGYDPSGASAVAVNTGSSILKVIATPFTGPVAPVITLQPQSQSVVVGTTVTFSSSASGTAPISYQWRKNGTNLRGATGTSLTLSNVTTSAVGNYSMVASNSAGVAVSSNGVLTVTGTNSVPVDGTVVPAESQNQTGDGGTGILGQVLREQDVYASSYFTNGPILITEIRFRPYRMVGAFSTVVSNLQISLSTTAARWDGLICRFET